MELFALLAQNGVNDPAEVAAGMGILVAWVCCGCVLPMASLGLSIYAVVDAVKNPNLTDNERLVWILVSIFVGIIGPILYFTIGKKR